MDLLTPEEVAHRLLDVSSWTVDAEALHIERTWQCNDFADALAFVNAIGKIAEEENHHPDIAIKSYKHVRVVLSSHSVGGLTEKDFGVAGRIDTLK